MKKLSKEEVKATETIPKGYGSPVRKALLMLKVGEGLVIPRIEWQWKKQTPTVLCSRLNSRGKYEFECRWLADKSGWLVVRNK